MAVIDVDSHFEPGPGWLEPFPELRARLPRGDYREMVAEFVVGDILRDVPLAARPPLEDLLPDGLIEALNVEKEQEASRKREVATKSQWQVADGPARVRWLDAVGIDVQSVICIAGMDYTRNLRDRALARDAVRACNTWLVDAIGPHGDRLLPVSNIELHDHDWALEELRRMRGSGSRSFLLPAEPVNGVAPCHPDWDPFWRGVTELGMVPLVHVGLNPARFDPGWANTGDLIAMRQLGNTQHHQACEVLLNALVFGGVFERHPTLTVLFAEVGIHWLPFLMRDIDQRIRPQAQLFLGKWRYPLRPSEYLRRNVRVTPLPSKNQNPFPVMDEVGSEMLVFSSDFPHLEGHTEPLRHYEPLLAGRDPDERARFLGGTMEEVYARMGDPLKTSTHRSASARSDRGS